MSPTRRLPTTPCRWLSRERAALALALAATLVLGACGPIITNTRQHRVANVRVESEPPGATVLVDGQARSATPTTVRLKYTVTRKKVSYDHLRIAGWAATIIGALAVVGSVVAFVVAAREAEPSGSDGLSTSKVFAAGGVFGLLIGGPALSFGIPALLAPATRETVAVEPSSGTGLELQLPGKRRLVHLRIEGEGAPLFDRLRMVRFDVRTSKWSAPNLPAGMRLEMRARDKLAPPSRQRPSSAPSSRTAFRPKPVGPAVPRAVDRE